MPFKRPHSPNYHIRIRNLPGYGLFPETSTHVTSKSLAQQMERMLHRIAAMGLEDTTWYDLLDAVRGGKRGREGVLRLTHLLKAYNDGTLNELRFQLKDPVLDDAIDQFTSTDVDYNTENGLVIVQEMARREFGAGCRLSILRSGKKITLLCARAEREGGRSRGKSRDWDNSSLARNTVVRYVKNSISKLCIFHFGAAAREAIFADVQYSAEDDTREIFLDGRQLRQLLDACEPWLRPVVLVAALTGADRAPLLRMRLRDVSVAQSPDLGLRVATVFVKDKKNDARPRSAMLVGPPADQLAELINGRDPDEKVFRAWIDESGKRLPLTGNRLRQAWERARTRAGFVKAKGWHANLRFKDVRHTAGAAFEEVGMGTTKIGAALGHKKRETSLKYTQRQVQLNAHDALKVARHLGIVENTP